MNVFVINRAELQKEFNDRRERERQATSKVNAKVRELSKLIKFGK